MENRHKQAGRQASTRIDVACVYSSFGWRVFCIARPGHVCASLDAKVSIRVILSNTVLFAYTLLDFAITV